MSAETGLRFGHFHPEGRLTNQELEDMHAKKGIGENIFFTRDDIVNNIGVLEARSIADPAKESILSMGLEAGQNALGNRPDVDIVLFSTSTPTGEDLSRRFAEEFGIRAMVTHNFHEACAGGAAMLRYLAVNQERFRGLRFAAIASEMLQPLLAKGEFANEDPYFSASTFADAAYLVSGTVGRDIEFHAWLTLGLPKAADLITMPNDFSLARGECDMVYIPKSPGRWIVQQGPKVFKAVMEYVPPFVKQLTEAGGLKPAKITGFLHQPSLRVTSKVAGALEEYKDIPVDAAEGNCSSGAALKVMERKIQTEETVKSGDSFVIVGFGAGMIIEGVAATLK